MNDLPRVSVVVPSYNHARWLRDCIDAVLAQQGAAVELIVVDDGSSDGSLDILRSYGDRLTLLQQRGGRQARARNLGLARATAPLVAFVDSDDRWLPGHLQASLQALTAQPDAAVVWGDCRIVDADGREQALLQWRDDGAPFIRTLLAGNPICNGTAVVRRAVLDRIGGFDERVPRVCDGAAWYQIAARGHGFVHIDRLVLDYRRHGGNDSARFAPMTRDRDTALVYAVDACAAHGRIAAADAPWLTHALVRQFAFRAAAAVQRRYGGAAWRVALLQALGSDAGLRGFGWMKAAKDALGAAR